MNARVPLLEIGDLESSQSRKIFEKRTKNAGSSVSALYRAVANSDNALAIMDFGIKTITKSGLDPILRELVRLTVAQETRSVVPWTGHYASAERAGVDQRLLTMIGTKEIEEEPAPMGIALRYARLLNREGHVDDSLVEQLRENLGNKGLVDLTMLIAFGGLLDGICNGLNIPLGEGQKPQPFVTVP